MSYLAYIITKELTHYYSFPTVTVIELESHSEMVFPAVTFCNLNSLSKSAFKKIDPRIDNYFLSVGPKETVPLSGEINWSDPFYKQEDFFKTQNFQDVQDESKPVFNGFLNGAYFDKIVLALQDPTKYFSVKLNPKGICLTFNPNETLNTSYKGSDFNLIIWLSLDNEDSYYGKWLGEGIKVRL